MAALSDSDRVRALGPSRVAGPEPQIAERTSGSVSDLGIRSLALEVHLSICPSCHRFLQCLGRFPPAPGRLSAWTGPESAGVSSAMSYGAVDLRQPDIFRSASQTRRIIMTLLGTAAACCLFALVSVDRRAELVEEADGLELNAFLSRAQVSEFKNLRNEQASLEVELDGLEKRERQIQPEDTKVNRNRPNRYDLASHASEYPIPRLSAA